MMREIVIDRASLVFRGEVLIEAKLKCNRTSKSFFAVFSNRLIMVMVAETMHYFLGAIARCLWFVIEPMSTRAAPIYVVIGTGLEDEPQAVVVSFVEDGHASRRIIPTQHYRVLDISSDSITKRVCLSYVRDRQNASDQKWCFHDLQSLF
jgi:hypothetical protein